MGQPRYVIELRGEGGHVGGGGGRALDGRGEEEAGGGAGLHWPVIILLIIVYCRKFSGELGPIFQ